MTQAQELTDDQRDIVRKVEKLLKLAGKSTSEAEATSATNKAMELLAAHNLTAAAVGSGGADDGGERKDERRRGGDYEWERDLMRRVSDLNFCLFFARRAWVKRDPRELKLKIVLERRDPYLRTHVQRWEYQVVGRAHNVQATLMLYDYLRGTIERLTREYLTGGALGSEQTVVGLGAMLRSRRAHSFREGVAEVVEEKLWRKRREMLDEEKKQADELREQMERAQRERAARGEAPGTAVTLASLRQSERDANMDHVMGEAGWSERQRREEYERRERQAAAKKAAEEEATRWAEAHPEEAAKQAAEERREARKAARRTGRATGPGSRGGTSHYKERDAHAYYAGQDKGASVGIDTQSGRRSSGSVGNTKRIA